jgi:hypothetical protein
MPQAHAANSPRPSARLAADVLVELYVPGAVGREKDLRARICAARDRARSKAGRASSAHCAQLYQLAASIAEGWWRQQGLSVDDLTDVLRAFSFLAIAAEALELLAVHHGGGCP